MSSPKFPKNLFSFWFLLATIATDWRQKLKSFPVFFLCISKIWFNFLLFFSNFKSNSCPPAIPVCPEQFDRRLIISLFCFSDNAFFLLEIISKAKVNNELPARTAVASPNFLCVDSLPLLIESLSIHGRSSWIKEYEWIHSTAAHISTNFFSLTFNNLPISKIIVDLIFFPPEITPYFIGVNSKEFFCLFKKFFKKLSIFCALFFNLNFIISYILRSRYFLWLYFKKIFYMFI